MKRKLFILFGVLSGICAALSAAVYKRYLHDIDYAWRTVLAGSKIVNTACGPIEYAESGRGYPVLVIHGASGGYDQGLVMARLNNDIYRCIAISRFGYLRTPMPEVASPDAQSDAHAAFLDALGLDNTAVIAGSAGGLSALHFALRYPERCTALILLSAVCKPLQLRSPVRNVIYGALYHSDFISWLTASLTSPSKSPLPITYGGNLSQLSKEDQEWLADFTQTTQPTSFRRVGMLADIDQIFNHEPITLEQISIPTLIVHAVDDGIVPIDHAYHAHQHIPGAELLEIPKGGHLLIGQHEFVKEHVMGFLQEHCE